MGMVWNERPCITGCICLGNYTTNSINKIIPIRIIEKNLTTLDSPYNNMMKCARGIYPGSSWHVRHVSNLFHFVNCKYVERPQLRLIKYQALTDIFLQIRVYFP